MVRLFWIKPVLNKDYIIGKTESKNPSLIQILYQQYNVSLLDKNVIH